MKDAAKSLHLVTAPLTAFKVAVAKLPEGLIRQSHEAVVQTADNMVAQLTTCLGTGGSMKDCNFTVEDVRHVANDMITKTRTTCSTAVQHIVHEVHHTSGLNERSHDRSQKENIGGSLGGDDRSHA